MLLKYPSSLQLLIYKVDLPSIISYSQAQKESSTPIVSPTSTSRSKDVNAQAYEPFDNGNDDDDNIRRSNSTTRNSYSSGPQANTNNAQRLDISRPAISSDTRA